MACTVAMYSQKMMILSPSDRLSTVSIRNWVFRAYWLRAAPCAALGWLRAAYDI
ncbi:hypothetical protein [Verminephrobacter eiseniae]|uniref:hypothetical protein n=1 Tax=Verminephrobacter eiseniae TaxID=364317 RepID=UPI001E2C9003|nr:hypothetical protein [Verminephrobacter eiseniae]